MIESNDKEFLYVEKYRPSKIDDCILPKRYKDTFKKFVENKQIPNLLLTGSAGVGKTTVAKALANELNADVLVINASENGNIDTLRTTIRSYASTMSLMGGLKIVILDEADYLNQQSTQPALRNFMEEFSDNCRFILTANFANRIIEPLHSRCTTIEFNIKEKEFPKLASQFMKRIDSILEKEGVKYEPKVVAEIITKYFPDFRKTLNELQRFSMVGLEKMPNDFDVDSSSIVLELLKNKEFGKLRKWVGENKDTDHLKVMKDVLNSDIFENAFIPELVLIYNTYDYRNAFVADREINLMAFLTECMINGKFK